MLGFAGSSTLPSQVRNCLGQVIEHIGMDKTVGIWEMIIWVIGHDLLFLEVNTVVAICREWSLKNVFCRKVGKHSPPMWPWGMQFRVCGTPSCTQNFFVQNDNYDVHMTCRFCGWRSEWVKEQDGKTSVFKLDRTLPNMFWHSYPASQLLQNLFVEVTAKKSGGCRWGAGGRLTYVVIQCPSWPPSPSI
jgi:hypothetical protein